VFANTSERVSARSDASAFPFLIGAGEMRAAAAREPVFSYVNEAGETRSRTRSNPSSRFRSHKEECVRERVFSYFKDVGEMRQFRCRVLVYATRELDAVRWSQDRRDLGHRDDARLL
jgi:hypothetical protein